MSEINMSELAKMMLQWEQAQKHADEIKEAIQDTVLQIGKTQTVGNVRASYSAGRKSYDYEAIGETAPPSVIREHVKTVVDWRAVCNDERSCIDKDDIPFTQSEPSVSVKLI